MAKPIVIPVKADERMLSASIERGASGAFRKLGSSAGAVAPLGRMMGRIRADADEFTKSIEASNARVIAFGASVGVINGISNAFKKLVETTVRVEKTLTDINVVLNTSTANIQKFGDGLFKVAKNTAQSFDVVSEAALEFSRQGLSIEETLRRTNDALILTRLTGLKAADSVKGLTAAVNGFGKAGLTTTDIINKLAAVDVQFAVSADDLIAALSRTGAVAQQAGMDLDELVGMVTAAQQVTARGGPVIGNAFKTIFTRVQRPETLNTLRSLGIAVDDTAGKSLSASKILKNLATQYDGLSRSAKVAVDQQVAGVFQINILKAAVGDLSKQNSLAARATQISAGATDQAIQKNNQLNQTIAALATQSGLALEELAKKIGDIALAPGMRDLVQSFKNIVEGITGVLDGEGTGSKFAQGLLKGIGNIITGPGLVVIGGVFLKLFKDLAVFGVKSLKNLLGLNAAAKQQAALQQGIGQLLAKNVAYEQAMAAAAGNVAKQSAITQGFLAKEVALRQRAAALTGSMAAGAYGAGFRVSSAGTLAAKGAGARAAVRGVPGFAPNFAVGDISGGILDIGDTFPIASAEVLAGTGGRQNFTISQLLKSLDKSKSAQANLKANMKAWFKENKITGISANLQLAPGAAVSAADVGDFIDRTYGSSRGLEIGQDKIGPRYQAILADARNIAASEGVFHGRPISAFTQALNNAGISRGAKTSLETLMNAGPVEAELVRRIGGSGQGLGGDFIVDAVNSAGVPTEVKNRLLENKAARGQDPSFSRHGGNIGGALLKSFRAKRRLYDMFGGSPLGERIQAGFRESHGKFLGSIGANAPSHMQPRGTGIGRFFSMFRRIPGFAPVGDAIAREKNQVGAMLGISPSSVKTKVIQNTALKSSFNPQGFGVISPTIGQRSFADARRMHKGEDLRTANLPNFKPSFPGAAQAAFPGATPSTRGPQDTRDGRRRNVENVERRTPANVKLVGMSETAKADMGAAVSKPAYTDVHSARAARIAGGAPPAAPAGPAPRIKIDMPGTGGAPASRPGMLSRIGGAGRAGVSGVMGAGRGLMGAAGAALAHPMAQVAMMAPFAFEMARGFVDQPTAQERFFMTPQQRRRAGADMARMDATQAGAISGAQTGALVGGGAMLALDAALLGLALLEPTPVGETLFGLRMAARGGTAVAGTAGKGAIAGGIGRGAMRGLGYGALGGAAIGGGMAFFGGPRQGKGFLSREEFAMGTQFLQERGSEQVGQMTSIRDNLAIASDMERTAIERLAANTAIQEVLAKIDSADARTKISKVLENDKLTVKEKSQQVLRIQTQEAENNQKRIGTMKGVQGLSSIFTARTPAAGMLASSNIANMLATGGGVFGPEQIMTDLKAVAKTKTKGDLISSAEKLDFEAIKKKFDARGFTPEVRAMFTENLEGASVGDMERYIDSVEALTTNFAHNEDLQHQIFSSMLVNKEIFERGAIDMQKVNAIIEDALKKSKAAKAIVKPSPTEINNFQKLLDQRRLLEDRLFGAGLERTAGINRGARGVAAGSGAINALMSAGLMTGPSAQVGLASLERAQFNRVAGNRRAGILDQATLDMGSIFGTPTDASMRFDRYLRGMVEGGDIGGALDRLRAMEGGLGVRLNRPSPLGGPETFGTGTGTTAQADVKLIREQIRLLEQRQKAIKAEDANTKAERENMEMRLRIAKDTARMSQPGIRAAQAMNLSLTQTGVAGSIAQAQESLAANRVGRNAIMNPFMTTNQQRDIALSGQLRNISFRRAQANRGAVTSALDLTNPFLNKFSGAAAALRERGGSANVAAAANLESAQTAFSTGMRKMIEGPGGATVSGIQKLSGEFYKSIGDIDSPEAREAKTQFAILMEQLKGIAQERKLTLDDLIEEESTAKQSRAMMTLKDVTLDFRDAFASAMQSVSTGSASASDALRDFGIAFFGAINARAIGNIADQVSAGIFAGLGGKQRGGFIKAQNGMYISGGRTGDKNPAMLEDGEYVLNRNAVKAMGGPKALDSINFNMAPRFAKGGGIMQGIGNILMAPFNLIGDLLSSLFGGRKGGNKAAQGKIVAQPGARKKAGDIDALIGEMGSKEAALRENLSRFGAGTGRVFSGQELSDRFHNIVSVGRTSGGKAAMAHYDQILDIYGSGALSNLRGANDQPINRSSFRQILQKHYGISGFQAGGKFVSPIMASGVPKRKLDKILSQYEAPATLTDPRLSGFAHANDPTLQNVRADIRNYHNEQIQKKFAKQAKRDQLMQTIVGAGLSAGISSGIGGIKGLMSEGHGMKMDPNTPVTTEELWGNFRLTDRNTPMSSWDKFKLGAQGFNPHTRTRFKHAFTTAGMPRGQRGGYFDNIPALLTGGEFVMNSSAVRRHGSGFFNSLNRGGRIGYQQGGLVGDQSVVQAERGATQQNNTSQKTDSNTTINITVNSGGGESETATQGQPGNKEKELAVKIRGAVLAVIKEEKRTGGTLRNVTSET